MERKEKGSDLRGEFGEKESRKAKSPLASKKQGCKETHPAEEKNFHIYWIVIIAAKASSWFP